MTPAGGVDAAPRQGRRPDREARTVRRGLAAGGVVWLTGSAVLVAVTVAAGGSGRDGLTAVLAALVGGAVTASGWLLLAAWLDLVAEEPPGRRRVVWTVAVVAFTFVSPLLVLGVHGGR